MVNLHKTLKDMFFVLGLDIPFVKLNEEDIALYNEYLDAKNNKDFAKSDEIRARLLERKIL